MVGTRTVLAEKRSVVAGLGQPAADRVVLARGPVLHGVVVAVVVVLGVVGLAPIEQARARGAAHRQRGHVVLEEHAALFQSLRQHRHDRRVVLLPVLVQIVLQRARRRDQPGTWW